jgi:hypothetical protein
MPLIDTQRRLGRTGAIRLGNRIPTGGTGRNGKPKTRPNKLDTFRVTSPHRVVADAVSQLFGGTVAQWSGPSGPEFEVITTVRELPILVPRQNIDPNYEMWGNRFKSRLCDGATERLRGTPCLCRRFDNHEHSWWKGVCGVCGVSESWRGEPHEHDYESGFCVTCGCRRPCKPTTRVNVMIRGVPASGVFKVESHGINAAAELPGFADMISQAPVPLPARLTMRYVDSLRLVVKPGGAETTESRKYWVPELNFDWLTPDMAYAGSGQLEQAARAQLEISGPQTLQAIGAAPERPADDTRQDDDQKLTPSKVAEIAVKCTNVAQVQQLWREAAADGVLNLEVSDMLTARAAELTPNQPARGKQDDDEPVDAVIVDEDEWPDVAPIGGAA